MGLNGKTPVLCSPLKLFERFDGALLCFEYVVPCQSQGYYFSSAWAKPEGEVDWDDSETFYKFCRLRLAEGEPSEVPDEGNFDIADTWYVGCERLEQVKDQLPHLYAVYVKAQQNGFDGWATTYMSGETVINYEVACKLANLYGDDDKLSVLDDCEKDMEEWVKDSVVPDLDAANFEFEMPECFPEFQTTPAF